MGCLFDKQDLTLKCFTKHKLAETSPPCPYSLLLICFYLLPFSYSILCLVYSSLLSCVCYKGGPLSFRIYIYIAHNCLFRLSAHGDCGYLYHSPHPPSPPFASDRRLALSYPCPQYVCRKQADIAYAEARAICLRNIVFSPPPPYAIKGWGGVRCVQGFSLASEGGCDCDAGSCDV